MHCLIIALSLLTQSFPTVERETLGGVWHVTNIECGGKSHDFLAISESLNGGGVTAVYHLEAIEIARREMTFLVGGHRLKATTKGRTRGETGSFKIRLLGKDRDATWNIDDNRLSLSIVDVEEHPVIITATRQAPRKSG